MGRALRLAAALPSYARIAWWGLFSPRRERAPLVVYQAVIVSDEGVVLALGALSAHIKAGAFRGLVASSRFPEFVDIPTMRELGYQEELFGIWFGFFAPAGIPEDARTALVGAIEQAVKSLAISARLATLGILQSYGTPEQTAAEIRTESRRVGEMARKTGLVK